MNKIDKLQKTINEFKECERLENALTSHISKLSNFNNIKAIEITLTDHYNDIHIVKMFSYLDSVNIELVKVLNKRLIKIKTLKNKLNKQLN